jgi:hypothetical protein
MLRPLCALLIVVASSIGIASASSGAILTMSTDKLTYNVGETVTVTVFGDSEGGDHVRHLRPARLQRRARGQRHPDPAAGGRRERPWPFLNSGDNGVDAFSDAFNRVNLNGGALPPGTLSTVTLIAKAVGVVDVNWFTTPNTGFELHFFGLTSAPGTSFSIVPEPTALPLIALGLLALGAARRPRRGR